MSQQCYYPNGTQVQSTEVSPCPNAPVTSICCFLGRKNPSGGDIANGFASDLCLSNGLCENRNVDNGVLKTSWWIEFCTDKDITSTKCLDVCRQSRNTMGNAMLTPCDGTRNSTRWCCGDSDACCTNNFGVVELPQLFVGNPVTSSTTLPPTSTPSTSTASTGTGSGSPTPSTAPIQNDSGLSTGAKAGIGIGVSLAVLAMVGAIFFFAQRARMWKKRALGDENSAQELAASYARVGADSPSTKYHAHVGSQELPHWERPSELPAQMPPAELPEPRNNR